jgi:diguanylate cyclase (GGDEF)-like protein/PAS domain S-box-containing protein
VGCPGLIFEILDSPLVVLSDALFLNKLEARHCETGYEVALFCADETCVRVCMADRTELLESALDSMQEGIALIGMGGEIAFWNQAAEATTGYAAIDVVGRPLPRGLEPLAPECDFRNHRTESARGMLVKARHKLGPEMQMMARLFLLRDGLGERIGAAVVFHPAESLDALPHGARGDSEEMAASQAEIEEHLRSEFEDCSGGGLPFGVLWVKVDQAESLHKSHGAGACDAMFEKFQHTLATGLRPAEILGRWGDDEFLIISHERTPEMLHAHARVLVGLARTADFKWWGDRVSLTVSIGAAQVRETRNETLAQLLDRAQRAMETSMRAGGNCATYAQGVQ